LRVNPADILTASLGFVVYILTKPQLALLHH